VESLLTVPIFTPFREHISNLKLLIQPSSSEIPAKKAKLQIYFQELFDIFKQERVNYFIFLIYFFQWKIWKRWKIILL